MDFSLTLVAYLLGGGGLLAAAVFLVRKFKAWGAQGEVIKDKNTEIKRLDHENKILQEQRDHGIHTVDDADDFFVRMRSEAANK